jgi:phosphoribosylformylglycinamidine (FGAM) synthase-like enzyme
MNSDGPNTCGYFRTFEQAGMESGARVIRGYHKPIMIAGGLGNVRRRTSRRKMSWSVRR